MLVLLTLALLLAGCGKEATPPLPVAQVTEPPKSEATEMPEYHWSQLLGRLCRNSGGTISGPSTSLNSSLPTRRATPTTSW